MKLGGEESPASPGHILQFDTYDIDYMQFKLQFYRWIEKKGNPNNELNYFRVELTLLKVRANPRLAFLRTFLLLTLRKQLVARHISPIHTIVAMARLTARMMRGNWRCFTASSSILGVSENSTSSVPTTCEAKCG